MFYEKITPNTSSIQHTFQNIPVSLFPKSLGKIYKDGELAIPIFAEGETYDLEAIAKDLNLAIQSSCRELQGGFNIFQTWRSSPIIDPSQSFNDLLKMDRFQYSTWWKNTYTRSNVDKIYQHYKENFL